MNGRLAKENSSFEKDQIYDKFMFTFLGFKNEKRTYINHTYQSLRTGDYFPSNINLIFNHEENIDIDNLID